MHTSKQMPPLMKRQLIIESRDYLPGKGLIIVSMAVSGVVTAEIGKFVFDFAKYNTGEKEEKLMAEIGNFYKNLPTNKKLKAFLSTLPKTPAPFNARNN